MHAIDIFWAEIYSFKRATTFHEYPKMHLRDAEITKYKKIRAQISFMNLNRVGIKNYKVH